jgi:outer membrane lipoprotein carrier protein
MPEKSKLNRLLKKTHMLRCARLISLDVAPDYAFAHQSSRASPLSLFEQPARGLFNQRLITTGLIFSVCLWLVLCWFAGQSHAAGNISAAEILQRLQKSYDSTVDFVADFRQETEVKAVNRSLKASGKVTFKRPGKMLWRYDEPKGQFVLADGKHLYFYQPEQNQIIKTPLKNAFRSDIPLSFLLGIGNLSKDFNAALKATEDALYVLRLEPKTEAPGLSDMQLGVNKESFDIVWASVRDAAGNLTTVRFSNMRKGTGVNDALFRLQVPNGVDIVELG